MEIFDKTMSALERRMDLHFKRHVILGGNVANVNTPNYRARELDFAGELQKAVGGDQSKLKTTHSKHLELSGLAGNVKGDASHLIVDNSGAVGADGNNVDLDMQMGKISSNSRGYTGSVNLLQIKLRIFRLLSRAGGGG